MNEDDKKLLVTGGCLSHVILFIVGFMLAVLLLAALTVSAGGSDEGRKPP